MQCPQVVAWGRSTSALSSQGTQGRAPLQANGGHLCQPSQKVLCLSIGSKDASFSRLQFHIRGAQQALHAASLTLLSQVSRPPSLPGDALEVHMSTELEGLRDVTAIIGAPNMGMVLLVPVPAMLLACRRWRGCTQLATWKEICYQS